MAAGSEGRTQLRKIGIGPLGDMAWGTHLCSFFETTSDLLETSTAFLKAGLESQEACIWVVSGRVTTAHATRALRAAVPDLDRHLAAGSVEIAAAEDWYLDGGRIDMKRTLRKWRARLRAAEARGYAGLRVTGSTAWLDSRSDWQTFLEYEAAVKDGTRDARILLLCSYPLRACGAGDVLDVARTHELAIARRAGAWQAVAWRELDASRNGYESLTPREREVLHLVTAGRRSPEIAGRLSISVRTVEVHRANLLRKLGVRNQTELVHFAMRRGLAGPEERAG
jgi:DNA-binding CsgD family transcriptional regulator